MRSGRTTELIHFGGLAVALVGFAITRFVVAGTVGADTDVPFLVGVIPLVIGLGLTIYGVVLAVGDLSRTYVGTVVRWTFLGVAAMLGVLVSTALGSSMHTLVGTDAVGSQLLVANTLLGGAVGGALIGDRAGLNRRQREEIELQAELATVANGLLRHEVLNATSIIDGYASMFRAGEPPRGADLDAIRDATDRIETTVSDITDVGRARGSNTLRPTPIGPVLREEADAFAERYPDAKLTVPEPAVSADVLADQRLRLLISAFLDTVAERGEAATIDVEAVPGPHSVRLSVRSTGAPPRADGSPGGDPAVDFDRRIVELLSDYYDGVFELSPPGSDENVVAGLELPRARGDRTATGRFGIPSAGIGAAILAGLVAGVVMGVLSEVLLGLLPVIGALYGVSTPIVGWVTHLFHSVVFALLFAAGYTHLRDRAPVPPVAAGSALGAAWGTVLWLVAAGIVMPVWLRLVGIEAPLPELTAAGFVAHAVWGLVVGGLYPIVRDRFASAGRLREIGLSIGRRFRSALG